MIKIDTEINKFLDQLFQEKKVKEEREGKIFRIIEVVYNKIFQLKEEKKEANSEVLQ
ncbi:unnamed protein product [Paramecium sonneborni]|uniref:Uncharacterized protein n=1 Tax=Paramecium sonneborni TaxID=65129 RepID=A0A8S1NU79_9CILI|nr:unnamed protein product [Paramecium sonneborni]